MSNKKNVDDVDNVDPKNKALALWLGWHETGDPNYGAPPCIGMAQTAWKLVRDDKEQGLFAYTQKYPDFYHDEIANASLRDKLLEERGHDNLTEIYAYFLGCKDWKMAVCAAALGRWEYSVELRVRGEE